MKLFLSLVVMAFGLIAHAAMPFKVSKECRSQIQSDLAKRNLTMTRLLQATFFPGGSDGVSSWDAEYILKGYIRDAEGASTLVLIGIEDSYNCRVQRITKVP